MNMDEEENLRIAAEYFSDLDFVKYHIFTKSDEQIIRRLMIAGPVLLRGPRGSGKSAFMKAAYLRMKETDDSVFPVYITLRHYPLLSVTAENYLSVLLPFVTTEIENEVLKQNISTSVNFNYCNTVTELKNSLDTFGVEQQCRVVLLFDDVAHIGRETPFAGFFDFFRTIASSIVSCKASIYPGVTKFGLRFDLYSDATVVEAQRDERSSDFNDFFNQLFKIQHTQIFEKTESKLAPILGEFLGRAVLGNVRAFNTLCHNLPKTQTITVQIIGESLKWLSQNYLFPALEELMTKIGIYAPLLEIAGNVAEIIFKDCGQNRVNSMLVHREHVLRIGKVFEILEYSGFIAKREASRALTKSGTGRGSRYALALGPLFENIHGSNLSYDLISLLSKPVIPPEQLFEYEPNSALKEFSFPDPIIENSLGILSLSIDKLAQGVKLQYGLSIFVMDTLKNGNYQTVGDLVKVTEDQLRLLPNIGEVRARRIMNVVDQAIWM